MKNNKTASKLQGSKIANKKSELLGKAIKALDNLTQKSTTNEVKKESSYKLTVIDSNKLLKEESKTLGYCIKVLLTNVKLLTISPLMVKNLQAINKDSEAYKLAVNNCRKSKNGNYSPFYLLQYLYSISK